MAVSMTVAQAMTAQLNSLPAGLRPPPEVFAQLLTAAGKLRAEGGSDDAQRAAVIYKLSRWGAGYGDDAPPTAVSFPADHRLHLNCGNEWYWVACHLEAEGPEGPVRIAVLLDMLRFRLISTALQKEIGWSDGDCQLVWNAVTVTVSGADGSRIHRRRRNVQWRKTAGQVEFPGEGPSDQFVFRCGPDVMVGPAGVLPLGISVVDTGNVALELRLASAMRDPFFLQGTDGITPQPRPGVYYSWPQLDVDGYVYVGDAAYKVKGSGWIDHQLLMRTPPAIPAPWPQIDGWNWCEFNFANGEAFTAAAFQTGMISVGPLVPYGFYLRRAGDGQSWIAERLIGGMAVDHLIPTLHQVMQATSWTYTATNFPDQASALARPFDLTVTTAPWIDDASFETADLAVPSEVPVSAAMVNKAELLHLVPLGTSPLGEAVTGVGFCETVNWEPWGAYQARALAFLKSGADA
jgi:predicted secreted hydrolase